MSRERWSDVLPNILTNITTKIIPVQRIEICPRAVKHVQHRYRVERPR